MNKLCECGCGKEVTNEKNRFINGHGWRGKKLSKEHKEKISKTHNLEEVKEKTKHTCLDKFGEVTNLICKETKDKIKQTCLEKYGVKSSNQSEEIKEKKKYTCLKKYGVEHPLQSKEIHNKFKYTMMKKYGVEYTLQSEELKEKIKQTCLDIYGIEDPNQLEEIKEKIKQTCLKHFGTECHLQSQKIKDQIKQTCLEKYGVDNYSKTFEFRKFAREQMISFIESGLKNGQTFSPMKGHNEKQFITELQKHTSYYINTDSKIIGYFPDGYIIELNMVIELDELYHNRTCFRDKDIQKDEDYQKIGLRIFRVKEKDYLDNKEKVIEQFKVLISEISNNG
jgi:very-short-patch-repair endonuclease